MNLRSQLLKGVLEGCILYIIKNEAAYGYELSLKLQEFGLDDISEGSIYPILLRLQKEILVYGKMEASLLVQNENTIISRRKAQRLWIFFIKNGGIFRIQWKQF